jgi:putative ABC transport system permease protein
VESLFGIPLDFLMLVFVVAFAIVVGFVAVLALRNRVFLKLGLRNIPRRRGRTILIVLGLMLGTLIISAAFSTGDTMTHTIRSSVLKFLGNMDESISIKGTDTESSFLIEGATDIRYFYYCLFA